MSDTALTGLASVPVGRLRPSPNNPRISLDGIEELAASIRENGLIQPIVVQRIPDSTSLQIVAGHRRWAAVSMLDWERVPCLIRRELLPDAELVAMLVENGQRAGLDPVEEAMALQRLVDDGTGIADLARRLGHTRSWVGSRLMLLELPAQEQEEVRAGHYSMTYAQGLVRAARSLARQQDSDETVERRPVGRPKGAKTKPYFGDSHALARAARARCSHRGSPKVGGVACGACWEAAIRLQDQLTAGGSAA